jgi:hypothetical protein
MFTLLVAERNRACTFILLAVERGTHCTSILLVVKGIPSGSAQFILLAKGGGGESDTPCTLGTSDFDKIS